MFEYPCTYDEKTKCWSGAKRHEIFNENLSIGELAFFMINNAKPENAMQISDSEGTLLTYGEALKMAIRLAQHFHNWQLNSEDVVSIFAPNVTHVMPVALASLFNCTPFQPMNTVIETHDVKQIFDKSRPKVIFCDGLHYEKLKNASEDFKPLIYTICNHLENVPKIEELLQPTKTEENYKPNPLTKGPSQTMIIMLSSGTTGLSKGICLSNRYCLHDLTFSYKHEIVFSSSSIDWLTGLFTLLINILRGGVRVISHKPKKTEYLLEVITKYKISTFITNPSNMLQLCSLKECTQEKLKSLRIVLVAGSHCSENNLKQMRSLVTNGYLYYGYGNTELGGLSFNHQDYKLKSVGHILPNFQMKIVDQTTGERLGPNEMGEVCLKKTNEEWLGYYKNPKATEETKDSEAFVHTGDLGYVDQENFLFVVDRCQDVFKHWGYKWSPSEIEMVINEMPDVAEVCVFDIFDEINLHVPAAAVVKKPSSLLSEEDVIKYVEQRIENVYKHLQAGVFIVEQLPRNRNGKPMRNKVKEICLNIKASASLN